MNSPDPNKNKARNWKANHLGTFLQKSSSKDATNNAITELTNQLSNGKFRDLHCTISIDRDRRMLFVKRWLDNVLLDEYYLLDISNVNSFQEVPQNPVLCNIVTFSTQNKDKKNPMTETHIFHFDDINLANYFASDIRSAKEACAIARSNSSPVKVLPPNNQKAIGKFDNFDSIRDNEDITSKTERNLLLLNYCFDDIEFFIQHLKDQEEARAFLSSNKGKSADRLLEGKAKPSTLVAYTSCIQKVKFCFNLLSKLDGKIKDPNSCELCRLLTEHLIKIGHAYLVYHKSKLNKVKEPLLTQSTIILLKNSLPNNHIRIWTDWGDFWNKPREKWNGYQEKYYPEFFNGYQIDIEDLVKDGMISPSMEHFKIKSNNTGINEMIYLNASLPSTSSTKNTYNNGKGSINQREEDFCRSVRLKNGRLYKVINTFTASKDQELSLSEGEIIEVLESLPDRSWWLCTNMQGQKGFSPKTILEPFIYIDIAINTSLSAVSKSPPSSPPSSSPPPSSPPSDINRRHLGSSSALRKQSVPSQQPKDTMTFEKSLEEAKTIKEELQRKLSTPVSFGNAFSRQSFARPSSVVSKKHGQISINQDSTSEEVQNWLRYKKFSDDDVSSLNEFTGQTLFLLSRDQMNRIVGVDVGARLDSFLKVQKSMSGFGTFSRNELNEILLKRKNQVDFQESF